jgi:uncharacterized protein involved in exopolysaccharide biosynthesis
MEENNITIQSDEESKINYFEWGIAVGREKITILLIFLFFSIVSIIYSLIITPTYTAKTILLANNSQQNSVSTAMSLVSNVANLGGGNIVKTQEEYYISLLQSDNLQNEVIKKLDLHQLFKTDKMVDARQRLKAMYRVSNDKKGGFIVLEVDSDNPEFSANLANIFVEELRNLLGRLALVSAKERLLFFEKAISKTQTDLFEAKVKFQGANEKSGVISSSGMTEIVYNQINNKELQLKAMSHFSTMQNPDVRRLEAELVALRNQLFKSTENTESFKQSEPKQQAALSAYREIKSLETILGALTSQYRASLTEAFSSEPFVQQLEIAAPPERRSKPQRTLIVIYFSVLGIILGLAVAIIKIQFAKVLTNAYLMHKFLLLKDSWLPSFFKK